MDGVIMDNMREHAEVFRLFAERYGVTIPDNDFVAYAGKGNDEIIPMLLPETLIEEMGIQTLSDEKEALYREYYAPRMKPMKGLVRFLADLRCAGLRCAVGSSSPKENVAFALDKLGLEEMFAAAVNGDMVTHRKPDPEIFLTAAEKLGIAPSECLVVEDALMGIKAARAAGMKVVALTTTTSREQLAAEGHPDLIVDDFCGLMVEALNKL